MKNIIGIFLLLVLARCTQREIYRYKATEKCKNLELSIARLYPKETVWLYYNNEVILKYQVDSLDGFRFKRNFCIDYETNGQIRIFSEYKGKKYIDTTLNVKKDTHGYLLAFSYPIPKNWRQYLNGDSIDVDNPVIRKGWGNVSIENSVRIGSLKIDTIYNKTWTDTY